ncbi:MAG TPA: TIGR00725 family protein [candidate division Zixibacteria bacterium]|nr:TIGR00725 family protein [candidate division Zixibacteria bacterium]
MRKMKRRPIIAVIGGDDNTSTIDALAIGEKTGKALIDNGFRIVTGGRGGVMEAVGKGGRSSIKHKDGDIIGILPSLNKQEANQYCDIVILTGLGFARNQIVAATGDAIVAIGGGSGTLNEIALAWQFGKPIFAFTIHGWSGNLAGKTLDNKHEKEIFPVKTTIDLIEKLKKLSL